MSKRLAWLSTGLRKLWSSAAGRDAFSGNNSYSRWRIPWLGNNARYFASKSKLRVEAMKPGTGTKPVPAVAAAAEKAAGAAAGEADPGVAAIKDEDGVGVNENVGVDEELKEYLRLRRIKENALMAEMESEETEEEEGESEDYEMEKEGNPMWDYRDPRELTPVIEELEKRLGELLKTERPDDRRVAVVRLKLAQQYYASESPDKVVSHANQALKVFGVGSDDSLEQGMCLSLLGGAYRRLEQADVSLSYLRRALRYFEEKEQQGRDIVGEKLPVLQELGLTLLALGRLGEGIDHLLEALELQEALLPPNDPVLGDEHRKVAEYLCDAISFGDAKEMCEKAIEIHSKDSGYYSPDVGVDRRLMAIIYTSLGEQEKALEQFRIVKQIFANEEDGGDREVFYANVGIAEAQMALERFSDAIATLEATSVPENEKILQGILYPNLAKAFFLNDNKEEARKHCKNTLEFQRENKTEGMGRHLVSIAALLDAMGDLEESITALKQAIVAFGDGNIMAVNAKVHLGTQLVRYGRSEEALVYYKEALERMEAENKTTVSLLSLTAIAYMELQKFESALELLERAKQAVEQPGKQQQQQPSESNFGKLAVYQNLVKAYSSLGRHDEAISHQKLVVNELQRSKETGKDAEGRLAEALLLLDKLSKRGEKVEEAPTAEAGG